MDSIPSEFENGTSFGGCRKTQLRRSLGEGHEFTRAVTSLKTYRALAPEVNWSRPSRLFPQSFEIRCPFRGWTLDSIPTKFENGTSFGGCRKTQLRRSLGEGHEFTRAVESLKIRCALAPEVGSLHPPQFFPWPVQPRRFEV